MKAQIAVVLATNAGQEIARTKLKPQFTEVTKPMPKRNVNRVQLDF